MDTTSCTTIVLALLWLSTCCQALCFLLALIAELDNIPAVSTTTTLSTVLLGVCLWQCKKAGYLVSPMTWYHWALLILLVILQVVALIMRFLSQLDWQDRESYVATWTYPIYAVAAVLLAILGGTLYCGWKCNLFCRPCCKSQYICYGSAIVVVLVILILLGVTVSMAKYRASDHHGVVNEGQTETLIIGYLEKMTLPITQCYTMAIIWNTTLKLPYTVLEVVALLTSALAAASLLTLAILGGNRGVLLSSTTFPFLALHLVFLGITWYCLQYKDVFYWPKDYMCFGIVVIVLLLVLIVAVIVNVSDEHEGDHVVKYILLGYSILLMVPTLWYAYRCGLLTWKWSLQKKKGLKATDSAESHDIMTEDTDIAK
ncbi:uncharacterized protein BBOV_I001310 [Babesia bovis T2Bo]|uniref:Membrane protein, putative n=1 Tax=Babesia bovis TaxID=5865 RepID=A7AVY7_BABBO|nr:uncharacterized protein BBOV_I001310 [Babesia bovis T2Bo]EDO05215.1 putative integral membrane protein [Babesia bovis T2Bo]|eukprot:XP_001608783.1 hypothetical protein [Babesia bovis T2Bo]